MPSRIRAFSFALVLAALAGLPTLAQQKKEELFLDPIDTKIPPISTDRAVKYDYDIVYVRTPRKGDKARSLWTEIAHPAIMDAEGDLMLLHPDGTEERLVEGGADGSVTDPYVSFDGRWVFYAHLKGLKGTSQHGQPPLHGADIYKIHIKSKKTETVPGDANTLLWKGKPIAVTPQNRNLADLDYLPPQCPPPSAVAPLPPGEGKGVRVPPLSDEEKRTFVRWIDLGCPIDLDFDPANPQERGYGWMLDDNRPTLTVTHPKTNANPALTRILVGMNDYDTGLDMKSFSVTADFAIDGVKPGDNLASRFKSTSQGVLEYRLARAIETLPRGLLTVSVRDRQGNLTRIERSISVGK